MLPGPVVKLAAACAAFLLLGPAALAGGAEHVGSFTWHMESGGFGGFSGFETDPGGHTFMAVTDQGGFTSGQITRDAEGAVTAVSAAKLRRLQDVGGGGVFDDRSDAESLARAPDGRIFIAYERAHRVVRHDTPDGPGDLLPGHPDFRTFGFNAGLEALAIDAGGALYAIPERSGEWIKPFPVYRFSDGRWTRAFDLPRRARHLPVGADFGPDGRLYLLERDFRGAGIGFSSRVRAITLGAGGIVSEETLLETAYGTHDNLEAIAVWRDAAGALRMTLLSDDNFSSRYRTEFVDYRLSP